MTSARDGVEHDGPIYRDDDARRPERDPAAAAARGRRPDAGRAQFTTDTSIAGTELAFGYLLLSAYFTGKIFNRFGFPKLTGYLLAGVISGPFVLGIVTKDMGRSLEVVKDTATAIIALEAGAELQLAKIKPVMKTLRGLTMFAVIGAMFTITGVLFLMRPLLPASSTA